MSDLALIAIARQQLAIVAHDARARLFGMDTALMAVSDALGQIAAALNMLEARGPPAPAERPHPGACECRNCALLRLKKWDPGL